MPKLNDNCDRYHMVQEQTHPRESSIVIKIEHSAQHKAHESTYADDEKWEVVAFMEADGVVKLADARDPDLAETRMRVVHIPFWAWIRGGVGGGRGHSAAMKQAR